VKATQLPLNQTGKVANVHAMIGWMRDDGAAFIGTPVCVPFENTYYIKLTLLSITCRLALMLLRLWRQQAFPRLLRTTRYSPYRVMDLQT
jgi:hypothetical protein